MTSKLQQFTFSLIVILVLIGCAGDNTVDQSNESSKPNVLLIITDDQGYGDLGIHGNDLIQTPNLDKLGTQSVRFTNFHVGTTCAPTRAGLMSGANCNRVGAWHTIIGRSFLSARFPTMANYLGDAGFHTGMFGKWHLGDNYPFRPQDRGFDEVVAHGGGGVGQTPDFWNNDYFDDTYFRNGGPEKFEGFCTDIWFDEAISFMKKANENDKPFFCYLSTNAPHGPHHAPQKYIDAYKGNEAVPNPNFYGQITNIDDNIGKLEKALEEMGIAENTIVIFMSDNGTAGGAKLDKTGQVTKGFNAAMRGKKGSEYEGGHRVPLFIRFPESMNISQKVFSELTSYNDILPTLMDLFDIPKKGETAIDGTSIKPLLTSGSQAELNDRILIADTQRGEELKKWKKASVMQNTWRLINNKELYNLETDPSQKENIIENHPDIAEKLSAAYETWWEDIQEDANQDNLISIGHDKEPKSLLTSHDWHSKMSPWHQSHIRSGKVDNGYWLVNIEKEGKYNVKLYRWPPSTNKNLTDEVALGDSVDGGKPFAAGVSLNPVESKIKIQDQDLTASTPANARFFEFSVDLKSGPSRLQTWMTDGNGEERGAYFVEIELEDGE